MCKVLGCLREEQLRRGFCKKHYVRFMKYGDPEFTKVAPEGQSLQERIGHIGWDVQGECWIWRGDSSKGYGRFTFRGRTLRSHREVYRLWNGEIPAGALIRHSCDIPLCINPEHLLLGDAKSNAQDMLERGRENPPRGSINGKSKLSEDQAQEILDLTFDLGPTLDKELSVKYGVSRLTIQSIRLRSRWKHLTPRRIYD